MAYNEQLAAKLREALKTTPSVEEKKMMGGLAFMVDGKMCVGVTNNDLMVRLSPEDYEAALQQPHVRQMDFTGKPLKSFVFVSPEGWVENGFNHWLQLALAFNPYAKASKRKASPITKQ